MKDKLNNILFICDILNKNEVEYLLIGGAAVFLHGYFRYSTNLAGELIEKQDIDVLYNPSYKNYYNLLNALKALGQDVSTFEAEQTPNPKKSFFVFEYENFTLDFLPELNNSEKFSDLFQKRELRNINNIDVSILKYEDLIFSKKLLARPKDLIDIEELEKIKRK